MMRQKIYSGLIWTQSTVRTSMGSPAVRPFSSKWRTSAGTSAPGGMSLSSVVLPLSPGTTTCTEYLVMTPRGVRGTLQEIMAESSLATTALISPGPLGTGACGGNSAHLVIIQRGNWISMHHIVQWRPSEGWHSYTHLKLPSNSWVFWHAWMMCNIYNVE